jgi:hypothetical protein
MRLPFISMASRIGFVLLISLLISAQAKAEGGGNGIFKVDSISLEYSGRQLSADQWGIYIETRWLKYLHPSFGISLSSVDTSIQAMTSLKAGIPAPGTFIFVVGGFTMGSGYLYDHLGMGIDFNIERVRLSAMIITSGTSTNSNVFATMAPGIDIGINFK